MTQNIFPLLSKALGLRINSCYSILFSNLKQKRTPYIKVKIDNTQQNSKCKLCGDKDETVNHMMSESTKGVQD